MIFPAILVWTLSLGLLARPTLGLPKSTVLTPFGAVPFENTHLIAEGGHLQHVGSEIHILDKSGNVTSVVKNDATPARRSVTFDLSKDAVQAGSGSPYAYWTNTGSSTISSFTAAWVVPPTPTSNAGQTIFLFIAAEPASGNAYLQPTLQYGASAAGGGAYWSVNTWYLVGSRTYYTAPVQVASGTVLDGSIKLSSSSGSSYAYSAGFGNVAGTTLSASGAQFVSLVVGLEEYGVTAASQLPSGSEVFYDIDVTAVSGAPSVTWVAGGAAVTIVQQGATNAEVQIAF